MSLSWFFAIFKSVTDDGISGNCEILFADKSRMWREEDLTVKLVMLFAERLMVDSWSSLVKSKLNSVSWLLEQSRIFNLFSWAMQAGIRKVCFTIYFALWRLETHLVTISNDSRTEATIANCLISGCRQEFHKVAANATIARNSIVWAQTTPHPACHCSFSAALWTCHRWGSIHACFPALQTKFPATFLFCFDFSLNNVQHAHFGSDELQKMQKNFRFFSSWKIK